MSIVVRAVGLLPRRWIRAVSRAQWRSPLVQRVFRAVRHTMRNRDTVIQKGSGKGLQFNAGSSNAGYVLGTTESCLQEALRLVLRPGATFYDVGANVGFLTVIGARLVGPSGLVHAFEPLPENVRWLRHNIALNGFPNVTVHAVALGKADGTADFHIGEDPNWGSLASPADGHEAMAVQVRRFDSLMTEGLPAPQVMKIDIEGGEIDMLLGAAGTLRAARPLLFIDLHGTNAGVADVLEPLDYDLHVFGGGGSSVRDAEWWVQILALPRERATELAPVVAALSSLTDGDHHAQAGTRKPLLAAMPRILIADALARLALRTPPLERALVASASLRGA